MAGSSCEKPGLEPEQPRAVAGAAVSQLAKENPFSVALMRRAYANLKAKHETPAQGAAQASNAGATAAYVEPETPSDCFECGPGPSDPNPYPGPVQPTHSYVRFKAATTDQLADLDDAGYRLSWEPLDESVAATTTVDFQSNDIAWVYTVVPTSTPLPAGIQSEALGELFLFTTEDGDMQDADPWEPTPDPGPSECQTQYDPSCNCYLQCPVARGGAGTPAKKGKLSNQAKAAQKLKAAGVSPQALYNEAMRLSGHADEALFPVSTTGGTQGRTSATRYHPRGKMKVQDADLGDVPLRGVKVESRRWFNLDHAYTDNLGNFSIRSGYLSLVKISLEFKNSLATTRGTSNLFQPWQSVLPINAELGSYQKGSMQTIDYTVTFQSAWESKGALTWTAATLFNSMADAQFFAQARGLPLPAQGINVWLFPAVNIWGKPIARSGSAPMLRRLAETSAASRAIDFLLASSGLVKVALVKQILQRQLPDVTLYYGNEPNGMLSSSQVTATIYHELAHTQHYNQVGNGFWSAYIGHIVVYSNGDDIYGYKSSPGSGRIAVSEGWGNYAERLYMSNKYQGTIANFRATNASIELENQVPNDVDDGWFVYGMYHDMTDNTPEPTFTGVTDNVTAFNPAMVFRGLQSDVLTVRAYQARINAQNNSVQASELNQLVSSYRW